MYHISINQVDYYQINKMCLVDLFYYGIITSTNIVTCMSIELLVAEIIENA